MTGRLSRTCTIVLALFATLLMSTAGAKAADSKQPGEDQVARAAAAPILVIEEPIFDFGTAEEGTVVTHAFKVKNTGNAVLSIHKVRPG